MRLAFLSNEMVADHRLLLACAQHTAGHRKYGDPLEACRRYADAFAIDTRQSSRGDAPVEAAVLDD